MKRLQKVGSMDSGEIALLGLDLLGTLAFAVNGAMTAMKTARLDIVGVLSLGMVTALGGGFIRDIFLDSLPPATFLDWRYLLIAAIGSLLAFWIARHLEKVSGFITVLDAIGLSLFAVIGALKALTFGLGPVQAIILGIVTAVGGGTLRDIMVRQIPAILHSELYAIPAATAAALTVAIYYGNLPMLPWAIFAALICFMIRMVGAEENTSSLR